MVQATCRARRVLPLLVVSFCGCRCEYRCVEGDSSYPLCNSSAANSSAVSVMGLGMWSTVVEAMLRLVAQSLHHETFAEPISKPALVLPITRSVFMAPIPSVPMVAPQVIAVRHLSKRHTMIDDLVDPVINLSWIIGAIYLDLWLLGFLK